MLSSWACLTTRVHKVQPQEFNCNGTRVAPVLHAKILAAPNCTVLMEGLCLLPCGSIVSESVFKSVRQNACTSECLLVGSPEVCVPTPRLQGLTSAPRRVLATPVEGPATKGRMRLIATAVLILMGVVGSMLAHTRAGRGGSASAAPLLG